MGHCNEIFGSNESRVPESVTVTNQRGEYVTFLHDLLLSLMTLAYSLSWLCS